MVLIGLNGVSQPFLIHPFRQCTGYLAAHLGIVVNESYVFEHERLRLINSVVRQVKARSSTGFNIVSLFLTISHTAYKVHDSSVGIKHGTFSDSARLI